MSTEKFYPKLSSIVTLEQLPEQLNFIRNGFSQLLDRIYYRDFQVVVDHHSSSIYYQLVLIIYKRLELEIPGTEIALLFNPPSSTDPTPYVTEIPVVVNARWPIRQFIKQFKLDQFSFEAEDFYTKALEIFNISDESLLLQTVATFIAPPDRLNTFALNTNTNYNLNIPTPVNSDTNVAITEIVDYIKLNSTVPLKAIIFSDYVLDLTTIQNTFENFKKLLVFKTSIDPTTRIKDLLIPHVYSKITLSAGIEFPRKYLIPILPNGQIETDENIKLVLSIAESVFVFDSKGQIGFNNDLSISFPSAYPKAQIGNTGFTIGFANAKLDLSWVTNIPEADADGRPRDFIGLYIGSGTIGFPLNWGHNDPNSPPSTGELFVNNLLVGTGGLSGTIGLRALTQNNPTPLLKGKFGQNIKWSLNTFQLVFQQNAIISSDIRGTLIIPGFTNVGAGDAILDINIHIGTDGDFSVTASGLITPPKWEVAEVFQITVFSAFVGRKNGRFYLGVTGKIDFIADIPVLGDVLPKGVEVKKLIIWDDGTIEFEGGNLILPNA
ncbi:MAG: hypothetical protein M3R25_06890, partial [Bacteroidota bacterium]|nr:hypothetical protein [Bacteroidota bacterium]